MTRIEAFSREVLREHIIVGWAFFMTLDDAGKAEMRKQLEIARVEMEEELKILQHEAKTILPMDLSLENGYSCADSPDLSTKMDILEASTHDPVQQPSRPWHIGRSDKGGIHHQGRLYC